jgi:phage terminase large subunit-like protein
VKKPALDPVTQYATDVIAGRVIAGRMVRLACQRHLADLELATSKGLVWKPDQAQRVIEFFPEVLCLPENTAGDDADEDTTSEAGKPFRLSPFQQFIAGSLFGWYTASGHRRFRIAYVETAKGSGKTPFGAGIMLYLLVADGERGAQVYAAAVTKDQAKLAFTDAERMVEASPALRDLLDQKVNNLAVTDTGSFFRPISSEKRGLDGKRVHGALIDELHEHPSGIVYLKMRAGTKGRRNALILEITNSGFDLETVCWQHHDYSRQVLEGSVANESWFAYVCHLDACEACHAAGKTQPADDCPDCDDWKTEGPHWLKANPNLGISLPWEYLREQVREAIGLPSQRNMVRRLNFCQWTQQATVWIPLEKWAACERRLNRADLKGRECFVGIDMSEKIDLTSVVLAFPRPLSANDPNKPTSLNRAVDVLAFFWLPKDTLSRRANEDKIPYPDWEKDGYLRTTLGASVDPDAIAAFIIDDVAKTYHIRGIGFDQAGAVAVVNRLQQHFGNELVTEIPQGFRHLSAPSKLLEALVVSGHLQHDRNACMNWCISNMAIEENAWREIRPVKISQRKRIDGGVALIDALAVMERTPDKLRSKYETGGLVTV